MQAGKCRAKGNFYRKNKIKGNSHSQFSIHARNKQQGTGQQRHHRRNEQHGTGTGWRECRVYFVA
jgi:hypothetical protein